MGHFKSRNLNNSRFSGFAASPWASSSCIAEPLRQLRARGTGRAAGARRFVDAGRDEVVAQIPELVLGFVDLVLERLGGIVPLLGKLRPERAPAQRRAKASWFRTGRIRWLSGGTTHGLHIGTRSLGVAPDTAAADRLAKGRRAVERTAKESNRKGHEKELRWGGCESKSGANIQTFKHPRTLSMASSRARSRCRLVFSSSGESSTGISAPRRWYTGRLCLLY